MQLDGLRPGLGYGTSVDVGVNIRLHHADAQLVLQCGNGAAQGSGLAGAGCAHQIQQKYLFLFQFLAQGFGLLVVGSKDALLHFQNFYSVHGLLLIISQ